jgi:hypothetical protein
MQQMQDWMLWQKETECQSLRSRLEEANAELQQLRVDNALLQEKLHQQEQRMQHELRLIKLAALRRRNSSSGSGPGGQQAAPPALLTNGGGAPPAAAAPHNHQIVVSPSPGDFMGAWVSQQPFRHHQQQQQQQPPPPVLARGRTHSTEDHPAESIEEPPHMAVAAHDDFVVDGGGGGGGGGADGASGGGGGGGASSFFSSTQSSSRADSSLQEPPPPYYAQQQHQQPPSPPRAAAAAASGGRAMSSQPFQPRPSPAAGAQQQQQHQPPPAPSVTPNEGFPPFVPSQTFEMAGGGGGYNGGGGGGINLRSEDSVTTDSEEGKDAFDSNSVTWPSENSIGPKTRAKASSQYKHKAGPLTSHNSGGHKQGASPPRPGASQHGPESATDPASRPTAMPSHRQNGGADLLLRAGSSNASVSSADMYVADDAADGGHPRGAGPAGPPHGRDFQYEDHPDPSDHPDEDADDELDDDIDNSTNLAPSESSHLSYGTSLYGAHMQHQQQLTGSGGPSPPRASATSAPPAGGGSSPAAFGAADRGGPAPAPPQSAPPRAPPPVKVSFVDEDNASVGHTVASSTFGEDRFKVVNQTILDPYGDKGTYTGVILRSTGMPHGSGEMLYQEDKRVYTGEWRHGRWHGYGRAFFANGDSYEGEYRFDQRHGRGIYNWADGRVYDGYFREDKRHGRGKFIWPDGAVYEGEFRNGQREGQGAYVFSDGGKYEGSWKDGRYSGFGICSWEDGRCYKGYVGHRAFLS